MINKYITTELSDFDEPQQSLKSKTSYRRRRRANFKDQMIKICIITAGILSAGLGLKGFLLPNAFIDGGATGISLLINQLTGIPLSWLLLLINIPFVVVGYAQIGKLFAFKTFLAIIGLALCIAFIDYPVITDDKLLVSVFGGFFLGLGIGLSIRGGSVIDGTEVLALYISKGTALTIGDVILIINIVIFSAAAILLNLEMALYSVVTYLSASKTVDYVVHGIEEYTGVTIISEKSETIRRAIVYTMGRGVTIYKGKRGYGKKGDKNFEVDVIFTVITRLEVTKLKAEIERIDEDAFVVMHSINETKGGMIKKRALH